MENPTHNAQMRASSHPHARSYHHHHGHGGQQHPHMVPASPHPHYSHPHAASGSYYHVAATAPGYAYPAHAATNVTHHVAQPHPPLAPLSSYGVAPDAVYATPHPETSSSASSHAKHSHAPPPPASDEEDEEEEFVQQIIVDWTAELDDRLQQWAAYCKYDWPAVGHNLKLPAFVCEHRYNQMFRRHEAPAEQRPQHQVLVRNKSWSTGNHPEDTYAGKVVMARPHHHDHAPTKASIVSRSNSSDTEECRKRKLTKASKSTSSASFTAVSKRTSKHTQVLPSKKDAPSAPPASTRTRKTKESHVVAKDSTSRSSARKHKLFESQAMPQDLAPPPQRRKVSLGSNTSRPALAAENVVVPDIPLSAVKPAEEPKRPVSHVEKNMFFFRVFWQGAKTDCLGFLTLSADATFADAREQIAEQLDNVEGEFQFLLDELGPVSRKQERNLGPIMEWLATDDMNAGSRKSPIRLEIVAK